MDLNHRTVVNRSLLLSRATLLLCRRDSFATWILHSYLVGEVGVEPTQLESNGFTDRPSSPALALAYIYGAGSRGRTDDLRVTNPSLYQLSYTSKWS